MGNRFQALGKRDRWALTIGATALLIFILVQFAFQPLSEKSRNLENRIKLKEGELAELKGIARQMEILDPDSPEQGRGPRDFNLFASLEKLATDCGIMDNVDYMKPGSIEIDSLRREEWVEIKLDRVNLKAITNYLYLIRTSGLGIYIKRFSARKDGELLSAVLQPAVKSVK